MKNTHPVEMERRDGSGAFSRGCDATAYRALFPRRFPGRRNRSRFATFARHIASFERTIVSADSAYDRFVWQDDVSGMSESARRGMRSSFRNDRLRALPWRLYVLPVPWSGKAARRRRPPSTTTGSIRDRARSTPGCTRHSPAGRPWALPRPDPPPQHRSDRPYMHDGRFRTLEEVVDHYGPRRKTSAPRPLLPLFTIVRSEKTDLIAFSGEPDGRDVFEKSRVRRSLGGQCAAGGANPAPSIPRVRRAADRAVSPAPVFARDPAISPLSVATA